MIGEFPGLDKLDKDGNVRATSDFRGLYGAICGDWFGVDPAAVLPERRHRKAGDPQVMRARVTTSLLTSPPRLRLAPPSRVLVEATEFRFTLSRTSVKAGPGDRPARDPRRGPARPQARACRQAPTARAAVRPRDAPGRRRRVARQAQARQVHALLLARRATSGAGMRTDADRALALLRADARHRHQSPSLIPLPPARQVGVRPRAHRHRGEVAARGQGDAQGRLRGRSRTARCGCTTSTSRPTRRRRATTTSRSARASCSCTGARSSA